ncbi:hypothetical protein DH2020_012814 [Rehmannia glutinosa]|uniref:Histone-lysine N-methyltransferase n=1 Tax=Rehmannia glutinosa TaxID=99300 RepID=A0ABR0X408_REHGL
MVVNYTDEKSNPDFQADAHTGNPIRRTSARIKNLEAKNSTSGLNPTEKSVAPVPNKMARMEKKRKIDESQLNGNTQLAEAVAHDCDTVDTDCTAVGKSTTTVATDSTAVGKSVYAMVTETLRAFNKHYLHFIQEEEKRCGRQEADKNKIMKKGSKCKKEDTADDYTKKPAKRPDLKAISEACIYNFCLYFKKRKYSCAVTISEYLMIKTGATLYPEKRFGSIPGIDVGHQFFSRAEMVVVGFHQHWLNGIDYIGKTACTARKSRKGLDLKGYKLPLAISIVLSGQYEDDLDNCEEIVYTGQGGHNLLGDKRQIGDQVLERGNLGLKACFNQLIIGNFDCNTLNCMEQSVPVRVVRGHKCQNSYAGKVYTYDGLYTVVNYWAEKGVSGFTVYKFRLKRLEGQPALTTKEVYFTRGRIPKCLSEIRGLVCEDITGGLEDIPIPVTNLVDDPPISPPGFVYIKDMKFGKDISVPTIAPMGCDCRGSCTDTRSCACAKLNGGDFPYVHRDGGRLLFDNSNSISLARLVEPKAVVFECGPNCGCVPKCVNRTSQNGPRFRLEVFRTPKKGWGVRSWDYIPSGAPVCEYIGLLRSTADLNPAADNSYVFDIDCLQTMQGLDGRESRLRDVSLPSHLQKIGEEASESVPFCIDAGHTGNVTRFINHSCQPNLFVQCMLSSHHDLRLARIILIAADNIPPLKELTYDYGYALDSVVGPDGKIQKMPCFCGADECRKRLY